MTIYLHPQPGTALADAYKAAFQNASEIFVLSAYLRDWRSFEISNCCENATLVVGKDFGITRKKALSQALTWKHKYEKICHFYVAEKINGFHPKLVMWKQGNEYFLIVGSSNLTIAAFESNYEANLRIEITEERYLAISNWIADILARSRPVTTEWINSYQEAPNIGLSHPQKHKHSTPVSTNLRLPRFPSLTKALAERKEQIYAFQDTRAEFEKNVRACAVGKVSPDMFYQWILESWNGTTWKFQGNGIFRHKQTATNWQMLCGALVSCLDSNKTDRDLVVQKVYDKLEESKIVEVRKAFLTEMLCHFFPNDYPLWNAPVQIWLKKAAVDIERPRGLTAGGKYIWLANQLRLALENDPDYPAQNLAELDHVLWAFCRYKQWIKK
ncbi:MAG: phospholipase D-like domain-containing protein [Polynucleobacter sp.]|uniref:phospholipase D-like domain-containing protein n=1 Tax=Polynucleobacter sp. TaxID=2029855 RepID=UPI0027258BCF|nr:phospholipase D-like domain-containing protein [Polynucleobacter sp.]MDO8713320.1 phospholipase D-like domain-containing protein [Polynucleobacter sp.]